VVLDGKLVKAASASAAVLGKLGWARAAFGTRGTLAQAWVISGLLAFDTVLGKRPKKFKGKFHTPKAVAAGKGVAVTLWTRNPTGMQCGTGYARTRFVFAAGGALKQRKVLGGFFLPCK